MPVAPVSRAARRGVGDGPQPDARPPPSTLHPVGASVPLLSLEPPVPAEAPIEHVLHGKKAPQSN